MVRTCAWCEKELAPGGDGPVTHGICPECAAGILTDSVGEPGRYDLEMMVAGKWKVARPDVDISAGTRMREVLGALPGNPLTRLVKREWGLQ